MDSMKETIKPQPIVRMVGIGKKFGGVSALQDVNFEIYPGETHIVAGENGAGKTTLIKILAGVHTVYEGRIEMDGKKVHFSSPLEASENGISVIHQELSLIPSMSVVDNLFLGRPIHVYGFINMNKQVDYAKSLLSQLGLDIDVNAFVETFPIAVQQLIEIAKALSKNAKIIIMDEPTSALSSPEVVKLFTLIDSLKSKGVGIVYITHKMEEIERIADRITVLRDGKYVGSDIAQKISIHDLIKMMVGREIEEQFPRHSQSLGKPIFQVENFSVFPSGRGERCAVDDVSFHVNSGEILGIGGLQGSGASQLLMGLFGGYGKNISGKIKLNDNTIPIQSPYQSVDRGIALLTNDRKATGLILSMSIIANATLANLKRLSPGGWRIPERERQKTAEVTSYLNLHAASINMNVEELSGGNQQKVVLAKWLQIEPKVLLLDEPTRGIDVGAKREIYQLMNEWTAKGIAIILITSEMPELLAMSDRVIVMHRGKITAELSREQATADLVLSAAMGKNIGEMKIG